MGFQETDTGLELGVVLGVVLIRPVARAWAENRFEDALTLGANLRQRFNLQEYGGLTTEAALNIWEAYALTYLSGEERFKLARQKLDAAIVAAEETLTSGNTTSKQFEARRWRARALLAFAYQVRGYLQRVRGFMLEAIADYRRAVENWREVGVLINLAATLNNQGFAMAEQGQWADAHALVNDALEIRRLLGPRTPVGLSLNTLALISTREGRYLTAAEQSLKSLTLFRALDDERRTGLALIALAEALRRQSEMELVPAPEKKVALIREARDHAMEAVAIFERTQEALRQVEALIEQGCACRDWVRVRRHYPSSRDNLERLVDESEAVLRRAGDIAAESNILYRQVDALVNLAFLGFYANRPILMQEAIRLAEQAIPKEYKLNPANGQPSLPIEEGVLLLWPQLGKLHTLYGHQAFEGYYRSRQNVTETELEKLSEAVFHYTLAMEYNTIYSRDHPGLRRSKDQIHDRLKKLEADQLRFVANTVRRLEAEYHLDKSEMRQSLYNRTLWQGE